MHGGNSTLRFRPRDRSALATAADEVLLATYTLDCLWPSDDPEHPSHFVFDASFADNDEAMAAEHDLMMLTPPSPRRNLRR